MKHVVAHYLYHTTMLLLVFFICIFCFRFFILDIGQMSGQSMEPMFWSHDFFLVNKMAYLIHSPARYDVVQLFNPKRPDMYLIKRIIGLPGETITIRENMLYVQSKDGTQQQLAEPYLAEDVINRMPIGHIDKITIPDDSYAVLGDNRLFSTDSRAYGPVHRRLILGKVIPMSL